MTSAEARMRPAGPQAAGPSAPSNAGVGDPPKLAPNVVLHGKLEDTGYEQTQGLAERDGAFVQLTPLLYNGLAQVDGTRSLKEIAERVSKVMGRPYDERNMRRLLEKLVPLGLIVDENGDVAPPPEGLSALRSPLAVNLRMKVVSSQAANAFARPFTLFFLPPIILAVVLAALAAHVWLYLVHGVAQGASQVIYNPGLTLAVMGAFVVAAAFHELGHAAGLRYGGGSVRAMGVGLYLVYPVFYTDITSSYALGRGARLRADLGGFYFNVIYQLVAIGLYFVTKQEFLVLVAMLVDFEILYQCLPFVRMDGYWILGDITGVPDFFTRMGAAIRQVFPGAPKQQLPPLRPVARVVFALYAIIVIPLLAILLSAAFRSFPTVVATAADSIGKRLGAAGEASARGDMIAAASEIVQLVLLLLQALGVGLVIFTVLRRLLTALWSWARPSTGRRILATATTAAGAALLLYVWLPPSTVAAGPSGGPAYSAVANAQPIPSDAHGTIVDAAPVLAPLAPALPSVVPTIAPSATPASSAIASVAPSATAPDTAPPTAQQSSAPTPTVAPTSTPAPSGTP